MTRGAVTNPHKDYKFSLADKQKEWKADRQPKEITHKGKKKVKQEVTEIRKWLCVPDVRGAPKENAFSPHDVFDHGTTSSFRPLDLISRNVIAELNIQHISSGAKPRRAWCAFHPMRGRIHIPTGKHLHWRNMAFVSLPVPLLWFNATRKAAFTILCSFCSSFCVTPLYKDVQKQRQEITSEWAKSNMCWLPR